MNIETQKVILTRMYQIFDSISENMENACKLYCSLCCTRNVTMTTLEGLAIADYLAANGRTVLFEKIRTAINENRFQPEITTNKLAELCLEGKDTPDNDNDQHWGKCPLLEENACTVYPGRPFCCRGFFSKKNCNESGLADVDPFIITMNHFFFQYIEHIDADGCFGNLTDILFIMESDEYLTAYKSNRLQQMNTGLVSNRPVKHLMVPPEHRLRIDSLLARIAQELNSIRS